MPADILGVGKEWGKVQAAQVAPGTASFDPSYCDTGAM